MNHYTEERLQQIRQEGYTLRFDEIFNNGFTIWKRITASVLGVSLLLGLPVLFLYAASMPWAYGIGFDQIFEMAQKYPERFQRLSESFDVRLKLSIVGVIIAALTAPLPAGILRMCHEADTLGEVNFGSAFAYYKPRYYGRILVITLFSFVMISVPSLFLQTLGSWTGIITYPYMLLMHTFLFFAVPLIIFADASPLRAIGLSFQLVGKRFFPLLGFALLGFAIAFLGLFVCCIGILLSFSYIYVINYLAYKQAIGFEPSAEIPDETYTASERI